MFWNSVPLDNIILNARHLDLVDDIYRVVDDVYRVVDDVYRVVDDIYRVVDDIYRVVDDIYRVVDDIYRGSLKGHQLSNSLNFRHTGFEINSSHY